MFQPEHQQATEQRCMTQGRALPASAGRPGDHNLKPRSRSGGKAKGQGFRYQETALLRTFGVTRFMPQNTSCVKSFLSAAHPRTLPDLHCARWLQAFRSCKVCELCCALPPAHDCRGRAAGDAAGCTAMIGQGSRVVASIWLQLASCAEAERHLKDRMLFRGSSPTAPVS